MTKLEDQITNVNGTIGKKIIDKLIEVLSKKWGSINNIINGNFHEIKF